MLRKYESLTKFTVTEDHLKLLRRSNVDWEYCEFGAPSIDCKRPYGNSDVVSDIAKILGWEYDREGDVPDELFERAKDIHASMETVLQILVVNCGITTGVYVRPDVYDYRGWRLKG